MRTLFASLLAIFMFLWLVPRLLGLLVKDTMERREAAAAVELQRLERDRAEEPDPPSAARPVEPWRSRRGGVPRTSEM